ncbi:MAG: alpha/beta hydrolase [Bacteroidia bacterium]
MYNAIVDVYNAIVDVYNAIVDVYNAIVDVFNTIVDVFNTIVDVYNAIVDVYNSIVDVFNTIVDVYNAIVDVYNAIVDVYNAIVDVFNTIVDVYNAIVDVFNTIVDVYNAIVDVYNAIVGVFNDGGDISTSDGGSSRKKKVLKQYKRGLILNYFPTFGGNLREMKHILITTLTLALLTSCSFNKIFLQPQKIPAGTKGLAMMVGKDTTVVLFSADKHQPTFRKMNKDTIVLSYTIESVVYKSANGNTLNGWFLKSKTQPATITLLHLHGNAGCLLSQYQAMAPLLKYGFQIFLFDYSGFGFSEGKATKNNVLIDALSSLDYLKSREDVKNTKLVIYGQSLGGHLAAVVGTQRQSDIDGLVIEGAFSSHKDIAAHTVPVLGRMIVKQGYCAYKSIKDFHKPLLIIHSTEDETIPFSMGKKIFNAANAPKEFFEIKKAHICGPEFYPNEIATKIKAMLVSK